MFRSDASSTRRKEDRWPNRPLRLPAEPSFPFALGTSARSRRLSLPQPIAGRPSCRSPAAAVARAASINSWGSFGDRKSASRAFRFASSKREASTEFPTDSGAFSDSSGDDWPAHPLKPASKKANASERKHVKSKTKRYRDAAYGRLPIQSPSNDGLRKGFCVMGVISLRDRDKVTFNESGHSMAYSCSQYPRQPYQDGTRKLILSRLFTQVDHGPSSRSISALASSSICRSRSLYSSMADCSIPSVTDTGPESEQPERVMEMQEQTVEATRMTRSRFFMMIS